MIKVAVAGAAGKMGATVCAAVEGTPDMELVGRADPLLNVALADVLSDAEVVVDFTRPDTALENALECVRAGVHVVIGTTGFDVEPLRSAHTPEGLPQANVLFAPNFAIGAVLMMRFAAEAAGHMARAEIVELHHDQKLDAPSGTAKRTAELMARGERRTGAPDPLGAPAGTSRSPGGHPRRRRPDAVDPSRHDRARVLHAGRAAGGAPRGRPAGITGRGAGEPAVLKDPKRAFTGEP